MKKYIALLLTALLFFASGCAKNSAPKLDPAAAADRLAASVPFKDQMSPVDTAMALQLYGLDENTVSGSKVYESTGATAEEIAVFEAKDATALN
jgi:PBP1b-binding outer membrane lipoprotein LpoB